MALRCNPTTGVLKRTKKWVLEATGKLPPGRLYLSTNEALAKSPKIQNILVVPV
jgi:hypothetical protein